MLKVFRVFVVFGLMLFIIGTVLSPSDKPTAIKNKEIKHKSLEDLYFYSADQVPWTRQELVSTMKPISKSQVEVEVVIDTASPNNYYYHICKVSIAGENFDGGRYVQFNNGTYNTDIIKKKIKVNMYEGKSAYKNGLSSWVNCYMDNIY